MSRERLPGRRPSLSIDFTCGDHDFVATVGLDPASGLVREIFLQPDRAKAGTVLDLTMRDLAIAISLALQHGCTVESMRAACLRNEDGSAACIMGAALDAVAAEVGA